MGLLNLTYEIELKPGEKPTLFLVDIWSILG
jgi:hypothetical protein